MSEWEWPAPPTNKYEESAYHALPSRSVSKEPPAPKVTPKLLRTAPTPSSSTDAAVAAAATQPSRHVRTLADYAWADDGLAVKIYVSVPDGLTKEAVSCEFYTERLELRVEHEDGSASVLALRRLYDAIHPPNCACRVQPSKGRIILILAKVPLAAGERVRIWPTLHFESGNASQLSADPRVAAGSKSQRSYEGAMLGMPTLPGQAGKQR